MNIHHLELFYYVARHGGISRAVRHIPYGIQQPAVSSQILQLEKGLETKLFERSPFQLTAEGEQLFAFVRPFFENLAEVAAQLSRSAATRLRIGASELVLRDHLPAVMQRVKKRHPCLRLAMNSGLQPQLEAALRDHKLDLAIVTALQPRVGTGFQRLALVRMPLVLLVHRDSPVTRAEELWVRRRIEEPLISLPASESVFQKGLKRLGVDWTPSIEASSLQLVTWYVANGYGIGVNVNVPEVVNHPDVRPIPLTGFDPVEIVALWIGHATPLIQAVLEEAQAYCRQRWPLLVCAPPAARLSNDSGGKKAKPRSPAARVTH